MNSPIGRLRHALLDLVREHAERDELPTSARFLFYELEQRGAIEEKRTGVNPKTGKPYVRPPVTDVIDAPTAEDQRRRLAVPQVDAGDLDTLSNVVSDGRSEGRLTDAARLVGDPVPRDEALLAQIGGADFPIAGVKDVALTLGQ
jgi:hypothetical protein